MSRRLIRATIPSRRTGGTSALVRYLPAPPIFQPATARGLRNWSVRTASRPMFQPFRTVSSPAKPAKRREPSDSRSRRVNPARPAPGTASPAVPGVGATSLIALTSPESSPALTGAHTRPRPKALDTMLVTRPPEIAKPHMVVIDHVLGTYFRPESDVLTIAGVPCQVWDVDPDTMPTGLPPSAPIEGAQLLTQRFPAMERAELARGYRAFDCYSADRHAILGAAPGIDGLYLATAFSGSGFKIAPAVGACMAELITEGRAHSVDITAFRPERFAAGQLIVSPHPYKPRRDHVEPAR